MTGAGAARSDWAAMSLRTDGLAVGRGGMAVLHDLSLTLCPGQAMVLRGPNGLGKTTLLRCLAGLQAPFSGTLTLDPDALTYAAHTDGVKSMLTVAENLRFWADVHGVQGVEAALAALSLNGLAHRRAGELSAGQKRRLGLARLLVTDRWLWLLDEPTVSLDAASVALFAAVLRGHLARGGAAVIATHIDLGLPEAQEFDLQQHRAPLLPRQSGGFDEAFA